VTRRPGGRGFGRQVFIGPPGAADRDCHYGDGRTADDAFGDTPQQEAVDPAAAVGPHHDDVDGSFPREPDDFPARRSLDDRRLDGNRRNKPLDFLQGRLTLSFERFADPLPGGLHR